MTKQKFDDVLLDDERRAWHLVKEVIKGYLGKNRSPDYQAIVSNMMGAFDKIGVNMSLKIHFLHHHLDDFANQLTSESDEQGERFHQTAMPFEIR